MTMMRWPHETMIEPLPLGAEGSYWLACNWLDLPGVTVEDWGCGSGYARKFIKQASYRGIDGAETRPDSLPLASKWDLTVPRPRVDCVLLRHVLEHNYEWKRILTNALLSFTQRMSLVLFTPLSDHATHNTRNDDTVPYLSFNKAELESHIRLFADIVETHQVPAAGGQMETVYLLEAL